MLKKAIFLVKVFLLNFIVAQDYSTRNDKESKHKKRKKKQVKTLRRIKFINEKKSYEIFLVKR